MVVGVYGDGKCMWVRRILLLVNLKIRGGVRKERMRQTRSQLYITEMNSVDRCNNFKFFIRFTPNLATKCCDATED